MSNPDRHQIMGAEISPYSVKVRSYFRYKQIPHDWVVRGPDNMATFQQYAKLPLIPLVITPDDPPKGLQDSTPIIEKIEAEHPEPSIHPADGALAFLSALLEEFGDEWGNKWMFHYRWWREPDQRSAAARIAATMAPKGATDEQLAPIIEGVMGRMVDRVWFVGSSEQTKDQIEDSFARALEILDAHLTDRAFLMGGRPCFGDFGLWGQLYNASTDPTPGAIMKERAPNVLAWIDRMQEPKAEGDFEPWASLEAGLMPLLSEQVGALFLPWSDANARCLEAGQETFSVELAGRTWEQKPQKYHARSLAKLRERYAGVADKRALDPILEAADCLRWLR